jgi:hypothetical protein
VALHLAVTLARGANSGLRTRFSAGAAAALARLPSRYVDLFYRSAGCLLKRDGKRHLDVVSALRDRASPPRRPPGIAKKAIEEIPEDVAEVETAEVGVRPAAPLRRRLAHRAELVILGTLLRVA